MAKKKSDGKKKKSDSKLSLLGTGMARKAGEALGGRKGQIDKYLSSGKKKKK